MHRGGVCFLSSCHADAMIILVLRTIGIAGLRKVRGHLICVRAGFPPFDKIVIEII